METRAVLERKKYEQMWTFAEYRDDHATAHARNAIALMQVEAPATIIDFGSGAGYASGHFRQCGLKVLAVDIARNAMDPELAGDIPILHANLWDLPVGLTADWGFCCDVMEHVPPDKTLDVLRAIRQSTRYQTYFSISLRPDGCGRLIGETLHLTVRPLEWWTRELGRLWRTVAVVSHVPGESAEFVVGEPREEALDDAGADLNGVRQAVVASYAELVRAFMPLVPEGPILDLGGGESVVLAEWRSRGFDAAAVDVTTATVSPGSLPYQSRQFSAVIVAHVLEHLRPEQLEAFITEAARLTARFLFIKVRTRALDRELPPAIEQPRAWWEARLLESGFTKHPLCQRLTSYEALERDGPDVLLAFERIPQQALERFPLSVLREERDLHMDMLREPGRRADAHVLRYTFASQFVHRQDRVLDAACGLGYGAAILHDAAGPASVHGLDASEYAVDYASAVFGSRRPCVTFSKADVMDIVRLPDESVDVVTSFETLEHIVDPRSFVREAARVLAPGGRFLCSVPNRWVDETGRDPNPFHLHVFDLDALVSLFEAPLRVDRIFGQTAGGGMKDPAAPRALYEVTPGDPIPDPEWWLLLATKTDDDGSPVRQGGDTGSGCLQAEDSREILPAKAGSRTSIHRANGVASAFRRKIREKSFRLEPEATHLFTYSKDSSSAKSYEPVWRLEEENGALRAEADSLRAQVRALEQACADHERNRASRLDTLRRRAVADPRGVAIFGAGEGGRRHAAHWRAGGGRVRCFTDNCQELWSSDLEGAPIIAPRELIHENAALIVIGSSIGVPEIVRQLEELGFVEEVDFVRGTAVGRS